MFALQVAVMKGRGGVFTSLFHYARMFDSVGVPNLTLYRGPAAEPLRAGGVEAIDAPSSLTSPLFPLTPDFGRLRREIRERAGGDPTFAMVHSDMALNAVKRMFPSTIIMTRCHSDKTKRKRNADIVVTLNPAQHEMITRDLAGARARTFLLGHPFMMSPPPAAVLRDGPVRINFVARFVGEKDPLTFMRALGLTKTRPLPEIRIIGEGPLEVDMREAEKAAGIEVNWVGWRNAPLEDFSRNDILVLPSVMERLPWLLLEAQARGVAIIASDISANLYALDEGAYGDLYKAGEPAALAERLDAALGDGDSLRAKAERGREDLSKRFGPEAFWAGLQDAMRIVKEGRSPHA